MLTHFFEIDAKIKILYRMEFGYFYDVKEDGTNNGQLCCVNFLQPSQYVSAYLETDYKSVILITPK